MQCCFSCVLGVSVGPLLCNVDLAEYSEDLLDRCEAELTKLREYYQDNKAIFIRVAEHEEMFDKFVALEVCEENTDVLCSIIADHMMIGTALSTDE